MMENLIIDKYIAVRYYNIVVRYIAVNSEVVEWTHISKKYMYQ